MVKGTDNATQHERERERDRDKDEVESNLRTRRSSDKHFSFFLTEKISQRVEAEKAAPVRTLAGREDGERRGKQVEFEIE